MAAVADGRRAYRADAHRARTALRDSSRGPGAAEATPSARPAAPSASCAATARWRTCRSADPGGSHPPASRPCVVRNRCCPELARLTWESLAGWQWQKPRMHRPVPQASVPRDRSGLCTGRLRRDQRTDRVRRASLTAAVSTTHKRIGAHSRSRRAGHARPMSVRALSMPALPTRSARAMRHLSRGPPCATPCQCPIDGVCGAGIARSAPRAAIHAPTATAAHRVDDDPRRHTIVRRRRAICHHRGPHALHRHTDGSAVRLARSRSAAIARRTAHICSTARAAATMAEKSGSVATVEPRS